MKITKKAQGVIDLKRDEIDREINFMVKKMSDMVDASKKDMDTIIGTINLMVEQLSNSIDKKFNEIKMTYKEEQQALDHKKAYWQGGGGINEPLPGQKKYDDEVAEKVYPRGGDELQKFFKSNLDYSESPYFNMNKLNNIGEYEKLEDGRFDK